MHNDVLLEIGLEELPARFIDDAEMQLRNHTKKWLEDNRISYHHIQSFSTPRRLAVIIQAIAPEQTTTTEEVRGPQVKIAKDESGNWTKAAIGFSKGQGKSPEDLYVKTVNNNDYVFVEKVYEGKETKHLLPEMKELVESIHFPQTMRWGSGSFRYARPIRWLTALYNDAVIPFEIAGVQTGNMTYGHRFLGDPVRIDQPMAYEAILQQQAVIADPIKREAMITEQLQELEEQEGFSILKDQDLLEEVRNLVEYPTVFFGTFHEDYLALPEEALITSMKEHQRYFPVKDKKDQRMLAYFIGVRNGDKTAIENVVKGNEKVLKARLADATFFYEEDKKHSIDHYMDKLKTVIFQEKIGTIHKKTEHNRLIIERLTEKIGVEALVANDALRAAEISKFDLTTSMVNEFTELQGIMGEKYATYFGESTTVAKAIREHYLPKQANGVLPESEAGALVSIADKLDTIAGCFSVGLIPTGSQDPYSLRRQAIGMMRILLDRGWPITVEALLEIPMEIYRFTDDVKQALQQFITNRASYVLSESEIEPDVVQAVLASNIGVLPFTLQKAALLSEKRNDASFKPVQEALVRILNLDKHAEKADVDPALFETASEQTLFETAKQVNAQYEAAAKTYDAKAALEALAELAAPIHAFFDDNMVMADDAKVRANRLAIIHLISQMIQDYGALSEIEWKQHF